jgi:hypothetical protein
MMSSMVWVRRVLSPATLHSVIGTGYAVVSLGQ